MKAEILTRHLCESNKQNIQNDKHNKDGPSDRVEVHPVALGVTRLPRQLGLRGSGSDGDGSICSIRLRVFDRILGCFIVLFGVFIFGLFLNEMTPCGARERVERDLVMENSTILNHGDIVGRAEEVDCGLVSHTLGARLLRSKAELPWFVARITVMPA